MMRCYNRAVGVCCSALLLLAGLACGQRTAVSVDDPSAPQLPDPPGDHQPGSPDFPCSGADRAICFGEAVPFNKLFANRRPADYDIAGDFISVRFAVEQGPPTKHTTSTSWSGVSVSFHRATRLQAGDLPLLLDLESLPAGWEVIASRYGGGCDGPRGPCKSNASPALSTDAPLLSGWLRVTASEVSQVWTVDLCLTARAEPGGEIELFVYLDRLGIDHPDA